MGAIIQYIMLGFVLLIFLQTQNCQEEGKSQTMGENNNIVVNSDEIISPLTEVKLKRYGGMMGHEENLRINKDSIYYTFRNREMYKPMELNQKTPVAPWDSIDQTFNVNELPKVQDGDMRVAFDGIDNVFILEGDFDRQEFRNPTEKSTSLDPFFILIDETRKELFDQIRKQ